MEAASTVRAIGTLIRSVMPVIMAWKKGVRGDCGKFDTSDDESAQKVRVYGWLMASNIAWLQGGILALLLLDVGGIGVRHMVKGLFDCDERRTTGIPDDIRDQLCQHPCAAGALRSDKTDAICARRECVICP